MKVQHGETISEIVLTLLGVAFWSLCVVAGVYLVVEGHPGWAWVPFVLAALARFKYTRDAKREEEE